MGSHKVSSFSPLLHGDVKPHWERLGVLESVATNSWTTLISSLPRDPRMAVETMNTYLEAVLGWVKTNKMKLNPDKMKVLLVGEGLIPELGYLLF